MTVYDRSKIKMKAFLLLGVLIGLAAFVTPSTAAAAEDTEGDAGAQLSPESGNTEEGHIEQHSDVGTGLNPEALASLLGGRRKRSAQYDVDYDRRRKRADEKSPDVKSVATLLGRRKRDVDGNVAASLLGTGTHQKRSPQDAPEYDVEYRRKRLAQFDFDDDDNDRRKRNAQIDDLLIFRKREATDSGLYRKRSPQDQPEYDVEYRRKRFAQVAFDDGDDDYNRRKRDIDAKALGSLAGGSGTY